MDKVPITTIDIILDNYDGVCSPGQTISGRVECFLAGEKKLRAIRIRFRGRAKTRWTMKKGRATVRCVTEEMYFNEEYNLMEGEDNFTLPGGQYVYPFSYTLPAILPSSFEDVYGKVRYNIKATIDRAWKFDYVKKMLLNVMVPMDLNHLPGLRDPVRVSVDDQIGYCIPGSIALDISLPFTGYAPDQEMIIGNYLKNTSMLNVSSVKYKVCKQAEFIAKYLEDTKKKYTTNDLVVCTATGVGGHGEKAWTTKCKIPKGHFPNLSQCNIINVTYTLNAKAVLPLPNWNVHVDCAITLGTVPLSGLCSEFKGLPALEEKSHDNQRKVGSSKRKTLS